MVTGMNTRIFKPTIAALIMFMLAVPAHALVTHVSVAHVLVPHVLVEKGPGVLVLARNDDKDYNKNDQYRLRKNGHQKGKSYKKENRRKRYMSLDESTSRVQRRLNGRILSAQPYEDGEHLYHRIKVLTPDGVVRVILINPETGEFD